MVSLTFPFRSDGRRMCKVVGVGGVGSEGNARLPRGRGE